MKSLIAILTGLHVLAHGVFGCCDHGYSASVRIEQPCECEQAQEGHQHSPSGHQSLIDEHSPAPAPHECIHASCHWLTSDTIPTINPLDASSMPIAMTTVVPIASGALHAADFWPDAAAGTLSAPPLRLHLSLNVILV